MFCRPRFLHIVAGLFVVVGCVAVLASPAHAAIFTVDDPIDLTDANPGDGVCATSANTCSLRAAAMEVDAQGGSHTILVPAGTYVLSIDPAGETGLIPNRGDLDFRFLGVGGEVEIIGAGADVTVIRRAGSSAAHRIFDIGDQVSSAKISGLTIMDGSDTLGGGIRTAATLWLEEVLLQNNSSSTDGSALYATGNGFLSIVRSAFVSNTDGGIGPTISVGGSSEGARSRAPPRSSPDSASSR